MSQPAVSPQDAALLVDFNVSDDEILRRFRARVRQDIADHLSSGQPVFYAGVGADAGKTFMRLPDGRRLEYRRAPDGTREIVRDVSP